MDGYEYVEILIYSTEDYDYCKDLLDGYRSSIVYDDRNLVIAVEEWCRSQILNILYDNDIEYGLV